MITNFTKDLEKHRKMSKNIGNIRKIHLKKVCRCCLSERGHLREIISTKIPMMLESCTSVKISEQDGLPKHVCLSCFHQIAKLYSFKKKVELSDRVLHNYVKQRSKVRSKEYSDILFKAVNDAEISIASEDTNTVIVDSNEIYIKSEDVPLILRCEQENVDGITRKGKSMEDKMLNIKHEEEIKDLNTEYAKTQTSILPEQIFNDGPPPLVPLEFNKSITQLEHNNIIKKLPSAPPLIPIKPLPALNPAVTVNNFVESIDKAIDLKLQCSICAEEFKTIIAFKEHRSQICQANELQCNICRKEFKDRKRLIGHLKGHMVIKDYRCKICGKCYPNPSTFRIHMRAHTGERPFSCQICNKGFARWAGVVGHMKTHNTNKPFKCDICGKGFKMSSNLARHKILHTGILPFSCSYCGKTFSQAENLQLHIRAYHTHEKPYLCNECGKGFVSLTRLNRHMWIHSGYKPYRCKQCPKAYSNSNDLKIHARNHSGGLNESDKPYACKDCDMRFFHPCRLAKHTKIHDRPFSCTECAKTFSTEVILNQHKYSKHFSNIDTDLIKDDTYVHYN